MSDQSVILDAIKSQGENFNRRMDMQERRLDKMEGVIETLARIEERQTQHFTKNEEQVNRIHKRIDGNESDIEALKTEISENRWLFKLGSSVATKIIMGAGAAGVIAGGAYSVMGG